MKNQKARQGAPRVFIQDTWLYPYRTPIFEALSRLVRLEVFFSIARPFDHKDPVRVAELKFENRVGGKLSLFIPFHILFRSYDIYIVGQIGVQSLLGALFVLLVARIKAKPLVLWTDYVETGYYRHHKRLKRLVGDWVARFYTRRCAVLFALGEHTRSYLARISAAETRILSYKQVVPEQCNAPPPRRDRPAEYRGKTIVLCMSYLRKGKGLGLLIEAFKKIDEPSAVLVIAGVGAEQSRLLEQSADCPNIKLIGYVEGEDKAFWYDQAELFVLPSYHETWGLVVNEAMYYGLPVVVGDAAGACELIKDHGNGLIFKAGDMSSLRSAVKRLLHDADLRRQMGEKSRSSIADYGLDYGVRSFVEVIECALQPEAQ